MRYVKDQPAEHRTHPGPATTFTRPADSCAWCSNTGRISDDVECWRCAEHEIIASAARDMIEHHTGNTEEAYKAARQCYGYAIHDGKHFWAAVSESIRKMGGAK